MNDLTYVAAGAEAFFKDGKWIFDISRMPVDYYLYNAVNYIGRGGIKEGIAQRKAANIAGVKMLCDSGGFQLATEVIKSIDPKGVIDVQNELADIGFILDMPTMKRVRGAGAGGLVVDNSDEYFSACLARTVGNLKKAKPIEKKFSYYGIVQGVAFNQLKRWYETIAEEDTFAGIGTKGVMLEQLLLGMFFVETTGVTAHHILGLGAAPRILLMRYFYLSSKKKMTLLTYDNTNHIQYGKFMQHVLPFQNCSYSKGLSKESFEKHTGIDIGNCNDDETILISIRNVYFAGMLNKFINMLENANSVKDFVLSNFKEMMVYINCIDDYFDKGIEYVLKKYPDLSFKNSGDKVKNIMDMLK